MQKFYFLALALKNFRMVGSIWPSSNFLVQKMLNPVDFSRARYILELGAGNGCITRVLLRKMRKDATLLVFETNKEFCKLLSKIKDPRLRIIQDSAAHLPKYMRQYQHTKADYIISSLPLGQLPQKVLRHINRSIFVCLKQDGHYIQYQYFLRSYLSLKRLYTTIQLDFTPWNIPPAFIYICRK